MHQCCNVPSLQFSSLSHQRTISLGTTRSLGTKQDSAFVGLKVKDQNGLITPQEQKQNNEVVESSDGTETSSFRFVDERWKQGTWDLNTLVKSGKMDWDALIVAEARRRKFLELYPEAATNQEPVLFRSSIIPWWAWITHSHLPEAELLNGRAAMIGFFMAYLVDVLTGLDVVGQSGNFICKIGLFLAVISVVVFRQTESLKDLRNLADEATFYDKQWQASWQDQDSAGIGSFHNLTSLKFLHISGNDFMSSSLVLKGLSSIGGNLISLDMSSCGVSSLALDSLHNLTSLLSLDLSSNQLTSTLPKSLGNLCNLRHADMGENYFQNISLTSLFERFLDCKLPSLESLSFESSQLSSFLPDQLGQLINLVDLQLGNNRIVGPIPDSIGRLSLLRSLDLDENLMSGTIPYSIGGLVSLELLDLSNNQLIDTLPESLGQLSKLNTLDLSGNLLTGVVTDSHFSKLVELKYLNGRGNNLSLRTRDANWNPSFKLQYLYLSSWDLGPYFPLWLLMQRDLVLLEIRNTKISSTMPKSFWSLFPNLQYLDLSNNEFQGSLFDIAATPVVVDLSSNLFSGKLPKLFNNSKLMILDLSNNSFIGSLHHLLCPYGGKWLESLNLANNHLFGVIPECWVKWPSLSFLNLENNNLSGAIPETLGSLTSLESLNMCKNKLSGRLPASIKNLKKLQILQFATNELVGRIPAWIGTELSNLRILNLRSNNFDGNIAQELCYLTAIQILDFAHNNLTGNIPRCVNNFSVLSKNETSSIGQFVFSQFDNIDIIASVSLVMKGHEYTYSTILGMVMVLDLSSNNFSGSIPGELVALHALQSLNLSSNQLTGVIPNNIGDLKLLESFDVSLNHLSGELPTSLSGLSFLSSFNVSFNNLSGRIPSSTQLQSFNESSFFGNKLCGVPLTKLCGVAHNISQTEGDKSHGEDFGLIISILSGFFVGFWAIVIPVNVGAIRNLLCC